MKRGFSGIPEINLEIPAYLTREEPTFIVIFLSKLLVIGILTIVATGQQETAEPKTCPIRWKHFAPKWSVGKHLPNIFLADNIFERFWHYHKTP